MVAQLGWKPISPVERGSAASRPLGQVGRRDASNTRQFGPRYSEIMSDNINMADQRREQRRAGAVLRSSSPASRRPPLQKVAPSPTRVNSFCDCRRVRSNPPSPTRSRASSSSLKSKSYPVATVSPQHSQLGRSWRKYPRLKLAAASTSPQLLKLA